MYRLPKNFFNHNHLSIATLVANGRCDFIFTSNFDNAIENALSALGINYEVFTWPMWERRNILKTHGVCVVKLHGCSVLGDLIFTSTELLSFKDAERYRSLENLLAEIPVLYCGYSGTGDIDILPNLHQSHDRTFWSNRAESEQENPFKKEKSTFITSNLLSTSSKDKILVRLSEEISGSSLRHLDTVSIQKYSETAANDWVSAQSEVDLVLFTQNLFSKFNRKLCMEIHIALDEAARQVSSADVFLYPDFRDPPYLGVPYNKACLEYLSRTSKNKSHTLYSEVWELFIKWRSGCHEIPYKRLEQIALDQRTNSSVARSAAGIGLGILAELSLISPSNRVINLLGGENFCLSNLTQLYEIACNKNASSIIEIMIVQIRHATINYYIFPNSTDSSTKVESVFDNALHLELWHVTDEAARVAMILDRKLGLRCFSELHKKIKEKKPILKDGQKMAHWKRHLAAKLFSFGWRRLFYFLELILPRWGNVYFDIKFQYFLHFTDCTFKICKMLNTDS